MARIRRRRHIHITVAVEESLLELVRKYSPLSLSKTIEVALRDFLQKHFGISYKLLEEKEYNANIDEQIKEYSEYYTGEGKSKPDLDFFRKFFR